MAATLSACGADPRPQLLLVVDSDAPTVGQARDDASVSFDAAIDTLRVDFLADGQTYDSDTFVAPEATDWPLSFGVRAPAELTGATIRLRLRAFRGDLAITEEVNGARELKPQVGASIDRVVETVLPDGGVVVRRVTLSLACLGRVPSASGCVDADRLDAPASEGLDEDDDFDRTLIGTSPLAREVGCRAPASDPERVCIPGGLFLLGDHELAGVADLPQDDPVPLRPVHVSPFWLDRTEVSVAGFALHAADVQPAPLSYDATSEPLCTWQAPDDGLNAQRPINCITWEAAEQLCDLRGGRLPTEAEWEYAASGRGQGRRHPWGDEVAQCCGASIDRLGSCQGFSSVPEPVGSHPREGCAWEGDVSRDGVRDLGGSMTEWLRDRYSPYGENCWSGSGILSDPVCDDGFVAHALRGGDFTSGLQTSMAALRNYNASPSPLTGVRCSYEDVR